MTVLSAVNVQPALRGLPLSSNTFIILIPRVAAEGGTHPSAKFAKAISHSDQRLAADAVS